MRNLEDEKPPRLQPGPTDPSELLRRYRAYGVRSGHYHRHRSWLERLLDRLTGEDARARSRRQPSDSAEEPQAPADPANPDSASRKRRTRQELRKREKIRSRKRNRRIIGRRLASRLRRIGFHILLLLAAAAIAYLLLSRSSADSG